MVDLRGREVVVVGGLGQVMFAEQLGAQVGTVQSEFPAPLRDLIDLCLVVLDLSG